MARSKPSSGAGGWSLRIGEVGATSKLRAWPLIGNYWKFIGWTVLVVIVGVLIAGGLGYLLTQLGVLHLEKMNGNSPPLSFFVGLGAFYLSFLLVLGVLWRIYFIQRVWKLVINSLTLHGLEAAREVKAREGTATALGEGLIDSLDVVGF
jgi:hypothetical protein